MVIWMPGPESFTGEDVVEFHVHGSVAVIRRLQIALGQLAGVRPAEAGEFCRRSFANGRMDLLEAEGLSDLLAAQTDAQHRQALGLVLGQASSRYSEWRRRLVVLMGRAEAAIDFVDEGDVTDRVIVQVRQDIRSLSDELRAVLEDAGRAKAIREGVKVVLAGPPNVGKSSLLNRLARRDAAIVSPVPGTTRDAIEVMIDVAGIPVILTDTAGLRSESGDEIEHLGMARARAKVEEAEIVLWISAYDVLSPEQAPRMADKVIHVVNKVDMMTGGSSDEVAGDVFVSAQNGEGIDELIDRLTDKLAAAYRLQESNVVVRDRHRMCLQRTIRHLNDSLSHGPQQLELLCEDLRSAAQQLGMITGAVDVEDVLDSIFAEFCIGK
jgi:tRNA modification GTPase